MRALRLLAPSSVALAALLAPRAASACGAAYPGGPVMCEIPESLAKLWRRPVARVSASYAFTSTTLLFGSAGRADLTRHAALAGTELPLGPRLSVQVGAGGVIGGALTHSVSRDEIGPGWSAYAGLAGRAITGEGAAPFVQLSGVVSTTHMATKTPTESPTYRALDVRLGAMVGKTFARTVTPYAAARVFGGPIFWRLAGQAATGTDLYKYQLGAGVAVSVLDRRLDAFVEGIALGERGVSAGLGTTFF